MVDGRRGFLRRNLGGVAAFLAGVAGGAGGMHLRKEARRFGPAEVKHSYAQHGEDLILWNLASQFLRSTDYLSRYRGAPPGRQQNTYLFYENATAGAGGADPALWDPSRPRAPATTLRAASASRAKRSRLLLISGDGN